MPDAASPFIVVAGKLLRRVVGYLAQPRVTTADERHYPASSVGLIDEDGGHDAPGSLRLWYNAHSVCSSSGQVGRPWDMHDTGMSLKGTFRKRTGSKPKAGAMIALEPVSKFAAEPSGFSNLVASWLVITTWNLRCSAFGPTGQVSVRITHAQLRGGRHSRERLLHPV